MGYDLEVDPIKAAHTAYLLTAPYVFSAADTRAMTADGADIIVCHMGLTARGSIGAATTKSLDECVALIDECAQAALDIREDVVVLCHDGPIAIPDDTAYVVCAARHCRGF